MHCLLFLAMAAGCGGRTALFSHDQAAPSGGRRSLGGQTADGGSGGYATDLGTSSGGGHANGGGGSDGRNARDAGAPVDQGQGSTEAGSSGGVGGRSTPCPPPSYDSNGLPTVPCKPWTDCPPGRYVSAEGTPVADRRCAPCPAGSYSVEKNAPECTPWLACNGWDQSEQIAGTPTSDRVCKTSDGIRGTGTDQSDLGMGIAVDSQGNVIIAGFTDGALGGAGLGGSDAFVRKFDARGDVAWTRQFGTAGEDQALAVAVAADGAVFVAGHTSGSLDGTSSGAVDAFVRKYTPEGAVAWTRQFGTADWDRAYAVAVDAKGNAYVAGYTNEASLEAWMFLRTYAPNGDLLRDHDLDFPSSTLAYAVAVDASGIIYLAGSTSWPIEGPQAGGFDAILMKIDTEGHVDWTRQYGSQSTDEALAVAIDRGGNPWVAGYQNAYSSGNSPRSGDGFVRGYTASGTLNSSYFIEDSWWGGVSGLTVDSRGHVFVLSTRSRSDPGPSFVSHATADELDAEGRLLTRSIIGDPGDTSAVALAANDSGRVYALVNVCSSSLDGHRVVGLCDAFVVLVR